MHNPFNTHFAMAGLYLHVPFCKQACHYCDFHFSTNLSLRHEVISAMAKEIAMQKDYLADQQVTSVYLGGGTPSLLTEEEINMLLASIYATFAVDSQAEITLEANPDDLQKHKLLSLAQAGINRLSIGIQSFHDDVLQFFNRAHTVAESEKSFWLAREAGFANISIDLMFSIPGQPASRWTESVARALQLNPEHISAYSLTIEEQTVFGRWQTHHKLTPVSDEQAAVEFEYLMDTLAKNGYEQYEISNFSKPNYHSRHNSSYWQQQHYLGIGPSAHSFNGATRQHNVRNNHTYLTSIKAGKVPFQLEVLSQANQINEYIFTTLRTSSGCDIHYLRQVFGYDLAHHCHRLVAHQLAELQNNRLILTRKGKLLADQIASGLFVEAD